MEKYGDQVYLLLAGNTASDGALGYVELLVQRLGCSRQVHIRPRPSMIECPLYYSAADIFVSPVETLQESFGLSPLEAMASGSPVVVSDWDGYRDTVIHGETGFRVTTYWANCNQDVSLLSPLRSWEDDHLRIAQSVTVDIEEMTRFLDILIGNPDRRVSMGEAAHKNVLAHFDWKCVMAQVYMLWQELSQVARNLPPIQH